MYLRFMLIFSLFLFCQLNAKILVITHAYNRPDFIEWQYRTFKKFLKDDYEYIVFNDGPTEKLSSEIEKVCQDLEIRCERIPQEIHQWPYLKRDVWEDRNCPSVRTANAVQYSYDILALDHEGIVAFFDSDMFLIREFSISRYLQDGDLAGVAQWRGSEGVVKYLWNGIMFFNMETLPNKNTLNFNCGSILGNHTDTGGYTYYYLRDNPEAKLRFMVDQLDFTDGEFILNSYDGEKREFLDEDQAFKKIKSPEVIAFLSERPDDVQFFLDFAILHYRRAGNYHGKSHKYHKEKTEQLSRFLESIL